MKRKKINKILLDRLITIKTDGFETKDKLIIAKDYLLKEIYTNLNIKESDISITDEVIRYIIKDYTEEQGVRSLKKSLYHIISTINVYLLTGNTELLQYDIKIKKTPVKVDIDMVRILLDKKERSFIHNLYI